MTLMKHQLEHSYLHDSKVAKIIKIGFFKKIELCENSWTEPFSAGVLSIMAPLLKISVHDAHMFTSLMKTKLAWFKIPDNIFTSKQINSAGV